MLHAPRGATDEPVPHESADVGAPPMASTGHRVRLGGHVYPVVFPNARDPRLHVAAVIITIHVLGQLGLHFWVSVPQILAAILTTAIIELAVTFNRTRSFVWPASAMLTGSGVALILRVPGTPPNDHWTFHAWYVFAGVAAFSLATKYVIRYRGAHLFNPSNLGLVVTFVVLGSTRVEPLDFWWAPLNGWMMLAYAVILTGGLVITRRLRLLAVVTTFWLTLAVGLGLVAASGHQMTARWAFTPVEGLDYWRVIMFSPELLIFMFFMITDPKTVPSGRVGRAAFGVLVALASTLMMAPQTDEFGTKVALLGGLVLMCAFRPLLDRLLPAAGSDADSVRRFSSRVALGPRPGSSILRPALRLGAIACVVLLLGIGVIAAGTSSRSVIGLGSDDVLARVPHQIDPATFPTITVEQGVLDWNHEIAGPGAQAIVLTLAENLELETQALLQGDASIVDAVDHGDRLDEMRLRIAEAGSSDTTVVERYAIDDVHVTLLVPFGRQDGLSLGLESRGTSTEESFDANGELVERTSAPFATTFVLRRATGDRWLIVDELPIDADDG